jgi:hypothetical protein
MIIPVLRTSSIIYTRNPDLTVGAITFRPSGPAAKLALLKKPGVSPLLSGAGDVSNILRAIRWQ